jgi:hypothetical protein
MGLDVQRTGPSRPLRTLSESPADDLAHDISAASLQPLPMPPLVRSLLWLCYLHPPAPSVTTPNDCLVIAKILVLWRDTAS